MMCDRGADDTAQPDDDNLRLFRKPCHGARLRMILWQMAAAKQHRRRLAHNMQRRTLTLPPVCDTPRQRRDQCWAETTARPDCPNGGLPPAYLIVAVPFEITTVSAPVSASRSPFGRVMKQPFRQNSVVSPAAIDSSDLPAPSVTISVRGSLSLLTTVAA